MTHQTKVMIGDGLWNMPMNALINENDNVKPDNETARLIKAQATVIAALTDYMTGVHNNE